MFLLPIDVSSKVNSHFCYCYNATNWSVSIALLNILSMFNSIYIYILPQAKNMSNKHFMDQLTYMPKTISMII